jgi:hypothetical protein
MTQELTEYEGLDGVDEKDIEFCTVKKRQFLGGGIQRVHQERLEIFLQIFKVICELIRKTKDRLGIHIAAWMEGWRTRRIPKRRR